MASRNSPLNPGVHFDNFRSWLKLEGEAEQQRMESRRNRLTPAEAERSGSTLLNMVVTSHTTGLGGRYLLTLQKRHAPERLPWHRFRVGSPVSLSSEQDHRPLSGVVSARRRDHIEVALNKWPEGDSFRVDMTPDDVTRKRQHEAMDAAEHATGRLAKLRDLLLYHAEPDFGELPEPEGAGHLDDSQRQAVAFALSAQDLAIIHGPPGTGKTTTVVEVIRQAVANGERVLACAPSNTAVDNLLERLIATGARAVRLGHPARVLEVVRSHTLDALVDQHDAKPVIQDMLKEADQLERRSRRFTRARPAPGQKHQQRKEARELRRHARMLEQHAINQLLADAEVICATVSFDFRVLD
ncbi:MAG: AAA family ATPase, partial [Planctomycetaceae bacterium]|nr:AAA family ATPase [Planctomycetaceae bacterium]